MTRDTVRLLAQVTLLAGANVLLGAGCAAQTRAHSDEVSGRIIWIEPAEKKGALKIEQVKGAPFNASVGTLVRKGSLLILDANARATVVCGNGKKLELAPGPQGCPCTRPCTPEICGINYEGSTIGATRAPDTDRSTFPVVVSPRKTMLRNLRPMIRWAPVAGAKEGSNYRVVLYGEGNKAVWSKEVSRQTRLNYPVEEASLKPGQTYKVVVTSEGLSSEQDHSPWLGFSTLSTGQARALADQEIEKRNLALPGNATRLMFASLYSSDELYAEAIDLLEELPGEMNAPAAARMLGDLYAVVGLSREAEKRYLLALSLTDVNDFDEQARINRNLARVYETLGNVDQAIARLQKAISAYRRLRNATAISSLLSDQRRLKKQQSR